MPRVGLRRLRGAGAAGAAPKRAARGGARPEGGSGCGPGGESLYAGVARRGSGRELRCFGARSPPARFPAERCTGSADGPARCSAAFPFRRAGPGCAHRGANCGLFLRRAAEQRWRSVPSHQPAALRPRGEREAGGRCGLNAPSRPSAAECSLGSGIVSTKGRYGDLCRECSSSQRI